MIREKPRGVVHFAAESRVDRSISGPLASVETNITGTCRLLMACRAYWEQQGKPADFRFVHVSTYQPSSPYSVSKAASDHLVRAWHHTFGFPATVTNCSNNYGPFQFPEQLIPLMITHIIEQKELPVYGDGRNVRNYAATPRMQVRG